MIRLSRTVRFLAVLAALAAPRGPAAAQVSPGPLSRPHASIDGITKCLSCHEAGRELSGRKCLTCHLALGERVNANRGFHATATRGGADLQCARCHSEHNGRPYQLVRWPDNAPRESFDHTRTSFRLEGAHTRATCTACHRAALIADAGVRGDRSLSVERTLLGMGTRCVSCHLDEHRGKTSTTCTDCHTQTAWKPAPGFDHARTNFHLEGRHRGVECKECHAVRLEPATGPGGVRDTAFVDFGGARSAAGGCASCHTSPHSQSGRMGRCESCHSLTGWFDLPDSLRNFDHAPVGFPLREAHAAADCEDCHWPSANHTTRPAAALSRANFLRPLSRQRMAFAACTSCHVEVHQPELAERGRPCQSCHNESRFAPTEFVLVAHDSTQFVLTGAHQAVPCNSCHPRQTGAAAGLGRVRFRIADRTCTGCHRDPHGRQFAGRTCEDCHSTATWGDASGDFDHETTRYPLRGAHAPLACSRCHTAGANGTVTFRGLPLTCGSAGCHSDPHGGQFNGRERGESCATCHDESAFKPARLDHQSDTDWPLDGAHDRAQCTACHRPQGSPPVIRWRSLPHRCEDCHTALPVRRP
jgi:hypothetical protein